MYHEKSTQYAAYNLAQQTVSKTRQIVMLYDGAIRSVRQAVEAMRAERIEDRFNSLHRASEIIQGLQSCLDFDNGGDIARILDEYYSNIDYRLLTVHRTNDIETCERVLRELKKMRDAWEQLDTQEGQAQPPATTGAANQQPSTIYMSA